MKKLLISLLVTAMSASLFAQVRIVRMETEHLIDPLGIDEIHPRLSWQIGADQPGAQQVAYSLSVGADSGAVLTGGGQTWQLTKQESVSQLVVYQGPNLRPFTRYFWSVTIWDQNGHTVKSPLASFETGMIDQNNWQGSWVTDTKDIRIKPAAYFRHSFMLNKKIVSARVYLAAAGLYELSVNGKRVGDHILDPLYTRFDRRNLYVTYDVTAALTAGENTVGVLLGNGWYNLQSTAVWYFDKAPWRARPSFCLDLRISYSDGTIETISSGKSWKTALSPVIFNSIYTAEHVDARLAIPHWNEPGLADSAWAKVIFTGTPSKHIVAEAVVPIRIGDTLPAVSMRHYSDTDYVFDIGRNIAGVSRITLKGPAGTVVRLKHGERLYPSGHVDQSNIDVHYRPTDDKDPFQTDIYVLRGDGVESFQPRFNYKGFQYVEVTSSQPVSLTKESIIGYFMHSDVRPAGTIQCSNPTINKIWLATNHSYLSNLFGYPTDCPQREKNGWTGDAQIAVETGLYNFDAITVYEKWLADLRDEQQPNGVLPSIVPTGGWGYEWGNGPDWTSAIAIIPWNVYLFYGDSKPLADCYENIKRYVEHINSLYPSGLTSWGLGDWIPVKSRTPVEFTSTAYYFADASILANAAKLLHKDADYATYSQLASKIKAAFNEKWLDATTGNYDMGFQTELSAALYWHLVPTEQISKTAGLLAARVKADSIKLDVGLLGTKTILNALSENGYADLAYQLASSEREPSWGWWIKNGATTLYENWPIDSKSDISMNHIMFGEIGAWFYKGLGGIFPDTAQPGFEQINLRPNIVAGLDSFTATHESPYGEISSGWKKTGGQLFYKATIPSGCTAILTLGGRTERLSAGRYSFRYDKKQKTFVKMVNRDDSRSVNAQKLLPYQDPSLAVERRVDDLIKRMDISEKCSQLQSQLLFLPNYAQGRNFSVGNFRNIAHFLHGNGAASPGTCAAAINEDTRRSIAASRFGIPVLQHGEALHGAQWGMATVFPQCIGLAASFDDSLVFRIGGVVGQELRAVGVRQVYAPVINIARDPRWGRMQETYGEDAFLTSRMGIAYTSALQQGGVIATLKHFVDNYGAGGHDSYASDNSWRVLREIYLEPFRASIIEGGAGGVMAAYNSVDDVPCSSNAVLLDDVLRKEWGFKGIVVSDYGGVDGVNGAHHTAATPQEAQAQSLQAGLDVMLANGYHDLPDLVKSGRISEQDIDRSLRRVLSAKFRLGLFDHPFVDTSAANRIVRSPEHRALALEAAGETMTLLKNAGHILPLSEHGVKRIGVFGPAANMLSLGDYSGPLGGWKGEGAVTPYQGLVNRMKGKAEVVLYQPGTDASTFARNCDLLIYFATIQEGEAKDRSHLELPSVETKAAQSSAHALIVDGKGGLVIREDQEQMIQTLAATGVKTIVVLQNGAPIDIRHWVDKVEGILEAWYPGEQGGTAIAAALFGDINPGGRLPVTWPKHVGQVPIYYAVKPSGRGNEYSDDDGKPLFPFGFGLSYTSFEYSNLVLPKAVEKGQNLEVRVTVKNTGTVKGDEVVQVYLHHELSSVVTPVKELKAFKRITLLPGESGEVVLTLPYRSFGIWDKDLKFVIEPGTVDIAIGRDAAAEVLTGQVKVD